MAEELYVEIMEGSKYDTEYLDNNQVDNILRYQKIWNNDMQERLDSCVKIIEQYKMELYKEYFNKEKGIRLGKFWMELEILWRNYHKLNTVWII